MIDDTEEVTVEEENTMNEQPQRTRRQVDYLTYAQVARINKLLPSMPDQVISMGA